LAVTNVVVKFPSYDVETGRVSAFAPVAMPGMVRESPLKWRRR